MHLETLLFPLVLAAPAAALDPVFVSDTAGDRILLLRDLDADGDWNDTGEVAVLYDGTAIGAVALGTSAGLAVDAAGFLYASDSAQDIVLRVADLDGDGDANDPGEFAIFFDGRVGGNASNVVMTSAANFCIDAAGVFWVASANTSSGNDAILRLEDVDGDGDANDAGEAHEYFLPAPGAATNVSIPTATALGPDGALYYAENGSAGTIPKGVYRLEDLDGSGSIDQPGESTAFFVPPPLAATAFHWSLRVEADGSFLLVDTGNDVLWRVRDVDGSGAIDAANESSIAWTAGVASLVWDLAVAPDGSLIAVEDQAPDRMLRLVDGDGDGVLGSAAGEVTEAYSDLVSSFDVGTPRAVALVGRNPAFTAFCAGDGTLATACPCANVGAPGAGCENSAATGGARLAASGAQNPDTITLTASGTPSTVTTIFLQGDVSIAGGVVFGDGLRCVGGTLVRIAVTSASGGVAVYPQPGDPSISARSAALGDPIAHGSTRWYQAYYRDPDLAFCPSPSGNSWNVSSGVAILW